MALGHRPRPRRHRRRHRVRVRRPNVPRPHLPARLGPRPHQRPHRSHHRLPSLPAEPAARSQDREGPQPRTRSTPTSTSRDRPRRHQRLHRPRQRRRPRPIPHRRRQHTHRRTTDQDAGHRTRRRQRTDHLHRDHRTHPPGLPRPHRRTGRAGMRGHLQAVGPGIGGRHPARRHQPGRRLSGGRSRRGPARHQVRQRPLQHVAVAGDPSRHRRRHRVLHRGGRHPNGRRVAELRAGYGVAVADLTRRQRRGADAVQLLGAARLLCRCVRRPHRGAALQRRRVRPRRRPDHQPGAGRIDIAGP